MCVPLLQAGKERVAVLVALNANECISQPALYQSIKPTCSLATPALLDQTQPQGCPLWEVFFMSFTTAHDIHN